MIDEINQDDESVNVPQEDSLDVEQGPDLDRGQPITREPVIDIPTGPSDFGDAA